MPENDAFISSLLQERDELYLELEKYRQADQGALEQALNKNQQYETKIREQDEKIKHLTDQLAWLRRKFWKPNSERFIPQDSNQRKIDFDGLDVIEEEQTLIEEAQQEILTYQKKKVVKKNIPVRLPLPEHLRREQEIIEPEGIDDNYIRIGEEITEVLEIKPGELYVRQIIRPKYVLKKSLQLANEEGEAQQGQKAVVIAALPLLPLPRSNAGASLLTWMIVGKYHYHIPFHRMIKMLEQSGLLLPASTVNGWFSGSIDLLRALYYRLRDIVLSTDYIQVDESTVPVISDKKQGTVKAYLWVIRAVMENLVFFHYDHGSRAQKVIVSLLHDFKGAVQTDGYDAYNIYEHKKGVLLLGCWAHARRKFTEALKEDLKGAQYALEQIGMVYQVESMADDQGLDAEQRADLRKRLAYPILTAFEKWLYAYYPKTIPKGRMYRAVSYTYNLFHRLSRYHLDGRYRIDNNLVENTIRPLAIGRKNFMFCGNHDAAENAAVIYSLLGTCKACGVDPQQWLHDVLTRLPYYNNDYSKDLAELLPHNWKAYKNSR
jgi:transposase